MNVFDAIEELESDFDDVRSEVDELRGHPEIEDGVLDSLNSAANDMEYRFYDMKRRAEKIQKDPKRWAKLFDLGEGEGKQILYRKGYDEEGEDESFTIVITVQYTAMDVDMKLGFETEEARDSVFEKTDWDKAWRAYKMINENYNRMIEKGL